jgi:hypothetical protein
MGLVIAIYKLYQEAIFEFFGVDEMMHNLDRGRLPRNISFSKIICAKHMRWNTSFPIRGVPLSSYDSKSLKEEVRMIASTCGILSVCHHSNGITPE